ncbi:MAG: ABC transporter ATP-binding protein/permease [Subdoligranulum variabile]|uniref:ABC transporter ATP-binding protein n=1 Tax=Gemmiger sp. TaxID=2049027 RepID=UPI002A7FE330|nr:ABC transporter ATP-binding protein [Gemmiger sp.]MCI7642053.1 ABC transporter ATP-binding protein/permease [Subdoligranulum variabile]MDD6608860.1 ABC transporter ATP-binding protein [Subdoligranulum variabile]MDY4774087.1 ABC transporter ATP-binding protein [Gemmiger sp.]MDY5203220.1 ABC transporter ATP-binding protein [Gemmiger sp.]
MSKQKQKVNKGTLRRVLELIRPYAGLVTLTLILAVVTVVTTLLAPVISGKAVDLIIGPGQVDFDGVAKLAIVMAGTVACTAVSQWLMNVVNNRITFHVVRDMRVRAFEQLEQLPLKYMDAHRPGDAISRITTDVEQFSDGLLLGFTQLFTGVLTICGTLGVMLFIDWRIALVVVALTPLSIFVARFIATHTYSMFKVQSETRAELTSLVEELVGNEHLVRAFGYESRAEERFDKINLDLQSCGVRAVFFSSMTNPCTRFVNALVYAAVGVLGAFAAIAGGITVGDLSVFLNYANQYTKPFNDISDVMTEFQNALACAQRVFDFINETPILPDAPDAVELPHGAGAVEFEHVKFRYVPDVPLIEDMNLKVEPGQRIALVGPTGCGKTTLVNLLMRFYEINGGTLRVDGHPIADVTRDSLRGNLGMVLQETWLKAGTIAENIAYGKPDATREEIIAAAKKARAHSFICRLPNGYDTEVAEDGGNISQGQRQLLCIARVMLRRPPILILDEATSSIDTRTEVLVQDAFEELMKGRTSFIVAHRLSTIKNADQILVMKDGNIIERGTHNELLTRGGFYAKLYESQFAKA